MRLISLVLVTGSRFMPWLAGEGARRNDNHSMGGTERDGGLDGRSCAAQILGEGNFLDHDKRSETR